MRKHKYLLKSSVILGALGAVALPGTAIVANVATTQRNSRKTVAQSNKKFNKNTSSRGVGTPLGSPTENTSISASVGENVDTILVWRLENFDSHITNLTITNFPAGLTYEYHYGTGDDSSGKDDGYIFFKITGKATTSFTGTARFSYDDHFERGFGNTHIDKDVTCKIVAGTITPDQSKQSALRDSPTYDIPSTKVDDVWSYHAYDTQWQKHNGMDSGGGVGHVYNRFSFQRSSLAFGFSITSSENLNKYFRDNAKKGYVKFIDLYTYQGSEGPLVKDLCLAMRNGYKFANVNVDAWQHDDPGKWDSGGAIPGDGNHQLSNIGSLKLMGMDIKPNQNNVTWSSSNGRIQIRYDADGFIMENILLGKGKTADTYTLAFNKEVNFQMSVCIDGVWTNGFVEGQDYQDGIPVQTDVFDKCLDKGDVNNSDFLPIVVSYGLCDIQWNSSFNPAGLYDGIKTVRKEDIDMYDIRGKLMNKECTDEWTKLWDTQLDLRYDKTDVRLHYESINGYEPPVHDYFGDSGRYPGRFSLSGIKPQTNVVFAPTTAGDADATTEEVWSFTGASWDSNLKVDEYAVYDGHYEGSYYVHDLQHVYHISLVDIRLNTVVADLTLDATRP